MRYYAKRMICPPPLIPSPLGGGSSQPFQNENSRRKGALLKSVSGLKLNRC